MYIFLYYKHSSICHIKLPKFNLKLLKLYILWENYEIKSIYESLFNHFPDWNYLYNILEQTTPLAKVSTCQQQV